MSRASGRRHVVVLAPMPLELDAIVTAFALTEEPSATGPRWTGRIGDTDVTAIHIGMGPPLTRAALNRLFDAGDRVDHVMVAGICGGLDPDVPVGTLVNPAVVVHHLSGASYDHRPPGDVPVSGKLVTTEGVDLDLGQAQRFFEDGFVGVDMETAAVAEVCEARGCPWSVYRCISDRAFDGLLDERIVAATKPDGSGDPDAIALLIAEDPTLAKRLEQLARDSMQAARLAAEAAVRGCQALDAMVS
jgi:adenosylhomocysteine nucleosidase